MLPVTSYVFLIKNGLIAMLSLQSINQSIGQSVIKVHVLGTQTDKK